MFSVREATPADVEAITEHYVGLHRDQWEEGGSAPAIDREPDWRSEVVTALADPATRVFVAEADGVAIGTARIEFAERPYYRIADIRRVYVVPEWRERGVATELMRVAEAAAREGGAREARLSAVTENRRAIGFYEKRGYDHFAVRMRKPL